MPTPRIAAALALFIALMPLAAQQKAPCQLPGQGSDFFGMYTVKLWPGQPPEAHGTACEDTPTLTVFPPAYDHGNGSAVLILPGGAYLGLAANHEGMQVATWFANRGFTAFVLAYRLSSNGYLLPVPLIDSRRAVQTIRARARDYKIDPAHIAILGFSAGGHLAALTAVQPIPGKPEAEDPVERVSSRPDYLILGYPWIGAISPDFSHLSYCKLFKVGDRCEALRAAYSPDLFVTRDTPPTFWFHTANDDVVPIEQGLRFYEAALKAGVPIEAHLFEKGPHGVGLGAGSAVLDQWPGLLDAWLRAQGLMEPAKTAK